METKTGPMDREEKSREIRKGFLQEFRLFESFLVCDWLEKIGPECVRMVIWVKRNEHVDLGIWTQLWLMSSVSGCGCSWFFPHIVLSVPQ